MGVAQIGHALRNEISPRQGPLRLREFTIIDIEFFFDPDDNKCLIISEVEDETLRMVLAENKLKGITEAVTVTIKEALTKGIIKEEWQAYFMALAKRFLVELGVPEELLVRDGAVSQGVAEAMATGVAQRFGADAGIKKNQTSHGLGVVS